MKLSIVTGQTTFYAAQNLIDQIDFSDFEQEHIVVVPDRFSLLAEQMVLSRAPGGCTFNVNVMGVNGLERYVLKKIGFVGSPLQEGERLLIMQQALSNCRPRLKTFKKFSINFVYEISKVISQLKSCNIYPDDLNSNCKTIASKNKLHDIKLVYEEYETILGTRLDQNKLLSLFGQIATESGALKDVNLYFAGFEAFTNELASTLTTLAQCAKHVVVALPTKSSIANEYIFEKDIFNRLATLAKENNVPVEEVDLFASLNKMQDHIAKNLFALGKLNKVDGNGYFVSLRCGSLMQEVSAAGRIIKKAVFDGARYCDFNIACSDLKKYKPYIDRLFVELDIPYYIDSSQTADSLLLCQNILKLLGVFESGFSSDSLLSYFTDSLCMNVSTQDIVERIEQFNIYNFSRFKKYLSQMLSPEQNKLFEDLFKAKTCGQYVDILKEYLQGLLFAEQNFLDGLGASRSKEKNINVQGEQILTECFDIIKKQQGQEQCSTLELIRKLKLLLSFYEVDTVPTYVDGVFVGDATDSSFSRCKNLIVLGGGSNLPRDVSDSGFLTDYDIEKFDIAKKIEPSIRTINRRNRFKLYNLLCLADEHLIVTSVPIVDGHKQEMPTYIKNLQQLFDVPSISAAAFFVPIDCEGAKLYLGSKKLALRLYVSQKKRNKLFSTFASIVKEQIAGLRLNKTIPPQLSMTLFFGKGYTSVSQLETYFSCPYKHFVLYGLRLKEKDEFEFSNRDIGNIVHKFAENFVHSFKDLTSVGENELELYVKDNVLSVVRALNLENKIYAAVDSGALIDYLEKVLLMIGKRICFEQKNSKFRPKYIEKSLEGLNLNLPNGDKIKVKGKVDRIDIYNGYFRIFDYKTGIVEPIVKDLYYGDKLQLFIYQRAVEKMSGLKGCAVLYFDARYDFDEGELLKGVVKNDDEIVEAFDRRLGAIDKSDILPVALSATNKNGRFKGDCLAPSLEGFCEYAVKVGENAIKEICEGYIEPCPDKNACEGCPARGICLYDKLFGVRAKERKSPKHIDEALKGGDDGI